MAKDERDILELLRTELDFLEKGGYGRSVGMRGKPTLPFRDSLICVNYALPEKAHPCSECHLIDFAPPDRRDEEFPCHHIPLNQEDKPVTVASLALQGDEDRMHELLKGWLRARISEMEGRRNIHSNPPGTPWNWSS